MLVSLSQQHDLTNYMHFHKTFYLKKEKAQKFEHRTHDGEFKMSYTLL